MNNKRDVKSCDYLIENIPHITKLGEQEYIHRSFSFPSDINQIDDDAMSNRTIDLSVIKCAYNQISLKENTSVISITRKLFSKENIIKMIFGYAFKKCLDYILNKIISYL